MRRAARGWMVVAAGALAATVGAGCGSDPAPTQATMDLAGAADLAGADLAGADLAGAPLPDLGKAPPDFAGVDLRGADLAPPPPDMTKPKPGDMAKAKDASTGPVDMAAMAPPDLTTAGAPDLTSMGTPDLAGSGGGFTTIFTIVMENHDYNEIVGSSNAPYINSLIDDYGLATNYVDSGVHPSLPNYLEMISGSTQGATSDVLPTAKPFPVGGENLGHQLTAAGIKWRAYQENMGAACNLKNASPYVPKHNPFLYFSNIQKGPNGLCAAVDVDHNSFDADLAAGTWRYMWITPNITDDGHDPVSSPVTGLKNSDAWLKGEMKKILASATYQAGGVVFITWDEAEGRNGDSNDQIPMIIVSPRIKSKKFTSGKAYSHASYLATVEDIFGLPRIGDAVKASSMMEFFQ